MVRNPTIFFNEGQFQLFTNTILDFYRSCSDCWYSEVFANIVVHFSNCSIQPQYLRIEDGNTINWPDNFNVTHICLEIARSVTITGQASTFSQPASRTSFCLLKWGRRRKGGSAWIASNLWSRQSPNLWTSQSGPLPSYKFSECKHPFVENRWS